MQTVDVLVVGGGIQGCGVAQATSAAGFSTLLLEQAEWGSATSSRSSKLIHGGLRYLQTGQFSLVRESLAEREWMLKHLPELVKNNWFYIPIYKSSRYRPWQVHLALLIYRLLSGNSKHGKFKKIKAEKWSNLAGIKQQELEAVFAYQDAQTDDRKLTQRVQQSAEKLGAECWQNSQLISAKKVEQGYLVNIKTEQTESEVLTRVLVNATGPWVNQTLAKIQPKVGQAEIDLVQGSHIIVDQSLSKRCFYLEAPSDHRAIFVLPWYGKTLIGTTETLFSGSPEQSRPLDSEIDYLINTVQYYFPQKNFTIGSSFSGLRVLPKQAGKAFSRPRDVMLQVETGLISLYGGKLTGWRATAAEVLSQIEKQLGQRKQIDSHDIPL